MKSETELREHSARTDVSVVMNKLVSPPVLKDRYGTDRDTCTSHLSSPVWFQDMVEGWWKGPGVIVR